MKLTVKTETTVNITVADIKQIIQTADSAEKIAIIQHTIHALHDADIEQFKGWRRLVRCGKHRKLVRSFHDKLRPKTIIGPPPHDHAGIRS